MLVLGIIIIAFKFRLDEIAYLYLLGALYVSYALGVYVYLYKSSFSFTNNLMYLTAFVSASSLALFLASIVYMSRIYIWVTCIYTVILNLLFVYVAMMRGKK